MHLGPPLFEQTLPVSAEYLHYHALIQRDISPDEARRWVAQQYQPQTESLLLPIKDLKRPALVALAVVGLVTGFSLAVQALSSLFF